MWFALLTGAIGFGGFFAVYSYVAPLTTEVTGLRPEIVPIALIVTGVGMTIGNFLGGRLADSGALRAVFISFGLLVVALLVARAHRIEHVPVSSSDCSASASPPRRCLPPSRPG